MHEFSIAMEIVDQVCEVAKNNHAQKITRLELIVGEASGIMSEALEMALRSAKLGTLLEQADIQIQKRKAGLRCLGCGFEFEIKESVDMHALCPKCNFFTKVIKGKELQINTIDVE